MILFDVNLPHLSIQTIVHSEDSCHVQEVDPILEKTKTKIHQLNIGRKKNGKKSHKTYDCIGTTFYHKHSSRGNRADVVKVFIQEWFQRW